MLFNDALEIHALCEQIYSRVIHYTFIMYYTKQYVFSFMYYIL